MKRFAIILTLAVAVCVLLGGAAVVADEQQDKEKEKKAKAEEKQESKENKKAEDAVKEEGEKKDEKTDKIKELEKLNGKELYKLSCKGCHEEDSPNGEYTPMSLIQEQWETFFDEKYVETHKGVVDSTRGAVKVVDLITPKMLEKIRKFAVNGAADSEQPMTCD